MDEIDRELFLAWSRDDVHLERLERTHKLLDRCPDDSTVLFSGGKDSTAVLDLAVKGRKCVQAVHYDVGPRCMPRPYYGELVRNMRALCDDRAHPVIIDDDDLWIPIKITHVIGTFRDEENGRRRRMPIDAKAFGAPCLHVIKDWTWLDVWAYIVSNDIPYHSMYDSRARIEGWDKARFSMFFADDLREITGAVDGLVAWRYREGGG